MAQSRIEQLRAKRADYEAERTRHRFLLDAYAGTGGFSGGREKLETASWWGWGADAYSNETIAIALKTTDDSEVDSYLDRFEREDLEKFKRRASLAQYVNHVANVVDIPLSYFHRKEPKRDLPDSLADWSENVSGDLDVLSWDEVRASIVDVRAVVLGWCPVLLWMPSVTSGEPLSQAQAEALGVRARVRPLFPANLYEWETDDEGNFTWCKVGVKRVVRATPFEPAVEIETISVWERTRVTEYEIHKRDNEEPTLVREEVRAHSWGAVPIVTYRWKPVPDDPVRGLSAIASSAQMAKRMFNYLSELDEHIRSCVFAFLQVPVRDEAKVAEVIAGNGGGIGIPPTSTRDVKWISPSPEVANILEKRIEETRLDIYRQARLDFTQATSGGGAARSGVSRAFEFETANRTIADFAKRIARAEERMFRLVSRMVPSAGNDTSAIRVTAVEKFSVEDMAAMLEEFKLALDMALGKTATVELKKRVVSTMLPNLSPDQVSAIEAELSEVEDEAATARAQAQAMAKQLLNDGAEDDGEDDDAEEPGDGDEGA